jgi:UDP-2,3-diacylglucosamine pyrophosphatase LpxH
MASPGRGAGSVEALRPLWQGFDRVVFNGDTAETRARRSRDESQRRVEALREAASEDGVELTLIAGNHDPFVSEQDWVRLAGGAVLVTHGDLLHPAIAPWSEGAEELEALHDQALEHVADDPAGPDAEEQAEATKIAAARHWRQQLQAQFTRGDRTWLQRKFRQLRKAALVLYYWHVMPKRAHTFAAEHFPACRFFIFGHIHRPGVWPAAPGRGDAGAADPGGRPRRVVINTGSFHMPCRPRAVTLDGQAVCFFKIKTDRRNGHRLAPRPSRKFDLHGREIVL